MTTDRFEPPRSEAQTRVALIDPLLAKAGWNLRDKTQVGLEIPVDGYDAEPWNGVTDYSLYDQTGNVLAVVEAKKCSRNPREADEQLRHYVTEIAKRQAFAPFGFMSNGASSLGCHILSQSGSFWLNRGKALEFHGSPITLSLNRPCQESSTTSH